MREAMRAAGVERRREGESPEEEERRFRERLRRFAVPDYAVTTRVDIREFVDRKREAVLAHRTQMGRDSRHARMPEDLRRQLWTHERYRLVAGPFAPNAEVTIYPWKDSQEHIDEVVEHAHRFLMAHEPVMVGRQE